MNPRIAGKDTHIPMLSGALLASTMTRVANKAYLKFCLDGKFRLLLNGCVLLTVGLIGKRWGVVDNRYKYTSEFHELGYCIAHMECSTAYVSLIDAILQACRAFNIPVDASSIKQWHGDMHLGIEKARSEVATHSTKVLDWAHVTGATTEGRSGIFALLKQHLTRKVDGAIPHYPFVHDWVGPSRVFPRRLFHIVWLSVFEFLQSEQEHVAVQKLQKHSFEALEEGQLIEAGWRVADDRVQPGSASGSASQESWHGTKLAQAIEKKYQSPISFAMDLQKFVRSRIAELHNACPVIRDWPDAGKDLDLFLVHGEAELRREGRSCALKLTESGLVREWPDSGNQWFLVPRTLLQEVRHPTQQVL